MFYLSKNVELTIPLLNKMFSAFWPIQAKRQKYKAYYDGNQAIKNKTYTDKNKECSQTVVNYVKNIVDSYCGYIATPGHITYATENPVDFIEIEDILRYNDYQTEDSEFLLDALVYGIAAELMYVDASGKTRFRLINPTQCFGVYDDSLSNDLLYFVRFYEANSWDDSDIFNVDVYSDYDIKHYQMNGKSGFLTFVSEEPHYFGQCPANIFALPDEKSIFDCVLDLQDAANTLLCGEIDDYAAFCDAYMILKGVTADKEDIGEMKENRVIQLPADMNGMSGSEVYYLTKNANDAQVENILNRIHNAIYRIAACPDFSAESFVGGVSSGVAIRYRLTGMEHRAGVIEGQMKKALQRRIEIICGIATLRLGEEVFRDIQIDFKRNIPEEEVEETSLYPFITANSEETE